jgi:hypothetical protein
VTPGIKKTGGGLFDPEHRNIYFAAGTAQFYPEYMLIAVNDLSKGTYAEHLDGLLAKGHKVFLDSGIFNLTNEHKRQTGVTMDEALKLAPEDIIGFDELFEKYVDIAKTYGDKLWGYIELDQGGAVNKRKTRAKLEAMGLNPIPVYHPLVDGWDYFDELASQYDRICFGNIVQANGPTRTRLLHTLWERLRQYPHLWVHVLGMTPNENTPVFPPQSCDSSTWLNGLRYPSVDMGSAAFKRGGSCGPEFLYIAGEGPRNRHVAQRVYSDEVESINDNWAQMRADTDRTFGAVAFPPVNPKEGMKL